LQRELCKLQEEGQASKLAATPSEQQRRADLRRVNEPRGPTVSRDWLWGLGPAHGATVAWAHGAAGAQAGRQRTRALREWAVSLRCPTPRPMALITLAVNAEHGAASARLPHEPSRHRRRGRATSLRAPGPGTSMRTPAHRRRRRATRLRRPADTCLNCRDGLARAPGGPTEEAYRARCPWGLGRVAYGAGLRHQSEVACVAFPGAAVKGSNNPTDQSSATGN
jgi:hypothetical protein